MNLGWVFVVAALGSAIGVIVGLLIYQMCQAGAEREVRRADYEAGYREAAERFRVYLERLGEAR